MPLSHRPRRVDRSGPLQQTERARRQGGYVLVKFALLLVPLLLMAGLSVDVGYWYNRAADIQKAADAAALAGVVWLPNIDYAEEYALAAAKANGFADSNPAVGASSDPNIDVGVVPVGDRRLRVTITDKRVGSFFYKNLGGRTISLNRPGLAEYVLPVPLGSPRNYFGTGTLLSGTARETLYQSINPACTNKVNGDRHQSLHFDGGRTSLDTCPSTATNAEYDPNGYELYIEAPKDRAANIEVLLYDPAYNERVTGTACGGTWTNAGTTSSNVTITGPKIYQTRARSDYNFPATTDTTSFLYVSTGNSYTGPGNLFRYRNCPAGTEVPIDTTRQTGAEDFTYTLYSADITPLNDEDNLPVPDCSRKFTASTAFDRTVLDSARWNILCTITPGMQSGRYILRVTNDGSASVDGDDGANQWGLVAKYVGAAGNGLCDGRHDTMCPRVYGRAAISVYANSPNGVANFFLAEIDPEHDGKTLELELWDPGEGGSTIEIQRPVGTDSWQTVEVDWASYEDDGGAVTSGSGTSIALRVSGNDRFNGRLLRIQIPLTDYDPPADNRWWKIQYTFAGGTVTDRTTWSARVIGDPVHLLEEEVP